MEILIPVVILAALGMLFGVGLALASKKFAVRLDPRLESIHSLLPGANCGACRGAGCFAFAQMLMSGKVSPEVCKLSNKEAKERITRILAETGTGDVHNKKGRVE